MSDEIAGMGTYYGYIAAESLQDDINLNVTEAPRGRTLFSRPQDRLDIEDETGMIRSSAKYRLRHDG